jgi:regulator of nucleoside diphosphate kinase
MMKPVISASDFKRLGELLASQGNREGRSLGHEMMNAAVVEDHEIGNKTIRLNSYVEVEDVNLKKILKVTIVLPDCIDLKKCRISVFAPLSVALLGFKEGDTIRWQMPAGETIFRILKVHNE